MEEDVAARVVGMVDAVRATLAVERLVPMRHDENCSLEREL
jgi:hypothetical protein